MSVPAARPAPPLGTSPIAALLLMLVSTVLLSSMHAIVRHVGQDLHPLEIVFFRNVFGLIAVAPLIVRSGWSGMRSHQPRLQVLRSVLGVTSMMTWFWGLSVVPIAEATALSFMSVIFASLGAVLFLGERMGMRRWLAVAAGFAGALVILRPGFVEVSAGMLVVLCSSFLWGTCIVIVKQLSRTDTVVSIVGWMGIAYTVISFFPALLVWQWPSPAQLLWLVLVGGFATAGHLAMTRAYKLHDATALLPLDYTRLVWASLIGYVAFAEAPDAWTWVGAGIIASAASYITWRESRGPAAG